MKNSRFGRIALFGAALALTASLSVGSALAYFTAYCTAGGSKAMELGFTTTEIEEDVRDGKKFVQIENTGDYDCYVRVKVFAPTDIVNQEDIYSEPSDAWEEKNDYWEYASILKPGEATSDLIVPFTPPVGEEGEDPEEFNIYVVYEYSPVFWILNEETGEYEYGPNWDYQVTETVTVPADNTDDSTKQEGNES